MTAKRSRRPLWIGGATAGIVAGLVVSVWWQSVLSQRHGFANAVLSYQNEMNSRLVSYDRVVKGVLRLFSQSDAVSQKDWNDYFGPLNFTQYTGLTSVGWSQEVMAAQKATYEKQNNHIFPAGSRDSYLPVTFLYPSAGLSAFFGFDTATIDPNQFKWVQLAIDSGNSQRTDAYYFTADKKTQGMFMVVPVYRANAPLTTVAQRRAGLLGVLTGNFRVADLIKELASTPSAASFPDLEIYDKVGSGATRMYDRDPDNAKKWAYTATTEIEIGNRPLMVKVNADSKSFGRVLSLWWLLISPPAAIAAYAIARKRGDRA